MKQMNIQSDKTKYYAIYNKISKDYYNPLYKRGLNTDTIHEIMIDDVFPAYNGVTLISIENIFNQSSFGTHIAPVTIPNHTNINYNEKTLEHNVDMCIIGDMIEFFDAKTIQMLIDNGADIEKSGNLLYWASYYGHLDIIKLIIKSSICIEKLNGLDYLSRFKHIIKNNNDLQDVEYFNKCLLIATGRGFLNIVKYFVEIGENLSEDKDKSCLKMACKMGHLDIVKYFVEKGLDIKFNNYHCLMVAAIYNHRHIIEYINSMDFNFIDHKKKCIDNIINDNTKYKFTSCDIYLTTKYLKKIGVNDHILYQILLTTCENENCLTAKYIIKSGIKPTNACLKIACRNNNFNMVKLITKYPYTKLNINIDNNYCLKQAQRHKNQSMINYLTNISN